MTVTQRQHQILTIIASYQEAKGYAPTIRDIMRIGGWKSPSTVYVHLWELRRQHLVDWVDGVPRTLRVVEEAPLGG